MERKSIITIESRDSVSFIDVRGLKIGEGIPKICVPILGGTSEEVFANTARMMETPGDLAEWRADWYEDVGKPEKVKKVLREIRRKIGEMPLLFTFRSAKEGGEKEITAEEYQKLIFLAAESGLVDLVDIEAFFQEGLLGSMVENIHAMGVKIVASNHDFIKTPDKDTIVKRLAFMRNAGADIPKIAVMPQNKQDVLTLLTATFEMKAGNPQCPIITMSMAKEGTISRLSGEFFGSAVTFASVGHVSAPGQMEVCTLKKALEILHNS